MLRAGPGACCRARLASARRAPTGSGRLGPRVAGQRAPALRTRGAAGAAGVLPPAGGLLAQDAGRWAGRGAQSRPARAPEPPHPPTRGSGARAGADRQRQARRRPRAGQPRFLRPPSRASIGGEIGAGCSGPGHSAGRRWEARVRRRPVQEGRVQEGPVRGSGAARTSSTASASRSSPGPSRLSPSSRAAGGASVRDRA